MTEISIKTIDGYPVVSPRLEGIPDFAKRMHWAAWIAEPRSGNPGKFNKAPRNPVTGVKVGANNPANFGTFEQARKALESGKYSGFGILLTGDDGVVGIDIDDRKRTFEQRPEIKAWCIRARKAGAYCETSPGGDGLRLFMRGVLPGDKGRKVGPLEIYADGRFLTVTGKRQSNDLSAPDLIDGQALIDEFLALVGPKRDDTITVSDGARPVQSTVGADPAQVETLKARVQEAQPFLSAGQWGDRPGMNGTTVTGYPSQSEADMAMVGTIAREAVSLGVPAEALPATVMAVFEQTGLYRPEKRRTVENYAIPRAVSDALARQQDHAAQVGTDTTSNDAEGDIAAAIQGDILAGRTYANMARGKMLWVAAIGKWMMWDGTRWVWCDTGQEVAFGKKVAAAILKRISSLYSTDPNRYRAKMQWATGLQNIKRLEAMIQLAKDEPDMAVGHMAQLDANHFLLCVRNGVLELKTETLLTADPKMLCTRQIAAEYHRGAKCPRWLKFLHEVFNGDAETIAFIKRAIGYTLTGSTTEEAMFICVGRGANGKSVFANVIGRIMADYWKTAPPALMTVRKAGDAGPRNDVAALCGARGIGINELQQASVLDEQVVKGVLAGREPISARFLHKEYFEFWPTFKAWLRTNYLPIVKGEDDGIWRRLLVIRFARIFAEAERNPNLEDELLEERAGILRWMVEGCLEWQRLGGLKPSATVIRESAAFRKESDLLGEFLDDKTRRGAGARVEQPKLYACWKAWNDANGTSAGSKANFTRKLNERGHGEAKSNGTRFYAGLSLREVGM